VREFTHIPASMGRATPAPAHSSSIHAARRRGASPRTVARPARQSSQNAAGSAKARPSTGRIAAAAPRENPQSSAAPGRTPSRSVATSAAIATVSHISVGTWFMCDADMKSMNGASAKSVTAPTATLRCCSVARTNHANAPTAIAPQSGLTSHGAPRSVPIVSIAGPPAGNWEYARPSA
jgi:hypothetical protein